MNNVIDEQVQSAQEKMNKAYQWGDVGYLEMNAINQATLIIQKHDEIESPQEFITVCHSSFEDLVLQWHHNHQDADGYGLATIRMIKRVLER